MRMSDVEDARSKGVDVEVVEPQEYGSVSWLSSHHEDWSVFYDARVQGRWKEALKRRKVGVGYAYTGSGADPWLKANRALLRWLERRVRASQTREKLAR